MSSLPSHLYSSSTCSPAHAIAYVPTLPLRPARPLLSANQIPVIVRTNVNIVEINLQEGTTIFTFPFNHLILCVLATFLRATSINVTPTKSRSQTSPPAVAERALPPHPARQPPSRPATSASSPLSRVMVPTHAVRNPHFCRMPHLLMMAHSFLFSCSRISSSARIFQPNAFPARVVARMSNFTGKRLRLVPVTTPLGPLPPRPRSAAASGLRGYRLISTTSSSRHRCPRHLSAPPPSLVQTRSSIPRLPLTLLPLLTLQIGRLQTCHSCLFPWHLNKTWL